MRDLLRGRTACIPSLRADRTTDIGVGSRGICRIKRPTSCSKRHKDCVWAAS